MGYKALKYSRDNTTEFTKVLRSRVRQYFKDTGKSKHANAAMVVKTICMMAMYFVPYALIVSNIVEPFWGVLLLFLAAGFGMAGIGLSIMHDANHGAYSKNPRVNWFVGMVLNLVGGISLNWKIQHNVLHHSFTNVEGHDEDIAPGGVLRFSPHAPRYKAHRLQHIYVWFFYGLMTMLWITVKDFQGLFRYRKLGLLEQVKTPFAVLLLFTIIQKIFYYSYALVIPLVFTDYPAWWIVVGFLSMHFLAGMILALIFQPAHVVPEVKFPLPAEDGSMDSVWFVHQLNTTANFGNEQKLLNWYCGGLNFQVEHHLFPGICHIHYPKIAKIVKATAEEYGLPYHAHKTFGKALVAHVKMLKNLGRNENLEGVQKLQVS